MSTVVLHRETKQLFTVADASRFSSGLWIVEPNLSAVKDVPTAFWKIEGDTITEMTQQEKEAELAKQIEKEKEIALSRIEDSTSIDRALAMAMLDMNNRLTQKINEIIREVPALSAVLPLQEIDPARFKEYLRGKM